MPLIPNIYNFLSRSFKYAPVKKLEIILRPLKHFLFGKSGIYEVIDIVKKKKGEGSDVRVVFDIGAASGDVTVTLLKSFPRAAVYCFEPLPESFAALKKCVSDFGERARCFNFALSDRNGDAELYIHPSRSRDSSSFILQPGDGAGNSLKVKTRRLDDVVRELGISKIDFMKIDVEGWEKELIEGGKDVLKNKTDSLFVEINPVYYQGGRSYFYIEVFDAIYAAGFSWVGIFGDFFFTKQK